MAEFFVTLSADIISEQIAALLNSHNKLKVLHNKYSIGSSRIKYFIEIEKERVIGCTGLIKENPKVSKSLHTCVSPEFRGKGLGQKLINTAIKNCETKYIYGTVRQDNIASLKMLIKIGFIFIKKDLKSGYYLYTMGRRVEDV